MKNLKIYYDGKVINKDFEASIKKLAEAQDLKFYASGMSLETGIRDIVFKGTK